MLVYGCYLLSEIGDIAARVTACTDDILSSMQFNRLQLNAGKTQLIRLSTLRQLQQLQAISISVGSDIIPPSFVCDLGVYIDADLSMQTHMQRTV